MTSTTRLVLFFACVVLAVVGGWALGDVAATLLPGMPVPGYDLTHLHDSPP